MIMPLKWLDSAQFYAPSFISSSTSDVDKAIISAAKKYVQQNGENDGEVGLLMGLFNNTLG
jgi:hypothetical protein